MSTDYDLIIVGGGSAGLTAAAVAVQLGARVALVEQRRTGGDCTWFGCVPSKTLLKSAKVAHQMRTADRYGLKSTEPKVDIQAVMAHVRSVIDGVHRHETPSVLRDKGIDVIEGPAKFIDPHAIAVGDRAITARRFLLCTGAIPYVPPIPGLDQLAYLTYETLWDITEMPQHLLVLGGGPIGCEMAQAFRRLGAAVTLVEGKPRLLPRDDADASAVIETAFGNEGIDLKLGAMVGSARQDDDGLHLSMGEDEVSGDALLVAVGRRPNIEDLELEKAGVKYGPQGIEVDNHLRTSQHHIYAAGDCAGGFQFTHYAGWQAFMAVRNALLPGGVRGTLDHVPWTTFTDPEVAHIGMNEAQARKSHADEVMTCDWPMDSVDRARTDGSTRGFIKLMHKRDGTLLGATIVAPRAGEMIHEWVLALQNGLKIGNVAETIHVYPTYSTANMQAAAHIRVSQLLSGTSGKLLKGIFRLMR